MLRAVAFLFALAPLGGLAACGDDEAHSTEIVLVGDEESSIDARRPIPPGDSRIRITIGIADARAPTTNAAVPIDAGAEAGDAAPVLLDVLARSVLVNGRFDRDAAGWAPEGTTSASWNPTNASGLASGSLLVTNETVVADRDGFVLSASGQCVPVPSGVRLSLAGRVFIPIEQGDGSAALSVQLFSQAGCAGPGVGGTDSLLVSGAGHWFDASGELLAPAAARSARVRLLVFKRFGAPAFRALFDDVGLSMN